MPNIRVKLTDDLHTALKVKTAKEKKTIIEIVTELLTNYVK